LVMNSLLEKGGLAGQVQVVYLDPPYGIKYGSNFQPFVNKRDVTNGKDEDLTQEPEMIRAFRDTWELGVHSYLTYLRDRLLLLRDLLHETGSCFIQIGDENIHVVRLLLDEVFGSQNFVSLITFAKTTGATVTYLPGTCDYLLWYARDLEKMKYRSLYLDKTVGEVGATVVKAILSRPSCRGIAQGITARPTTHDGEENNPGENRPGPPVHLGTPAIGISPGNGQDMELWSTEGEREKRINLLDSLTTTSSRGGNKRTFLRRFSQIASFFRWMAPHSGHH